MRRSSIHCAVVRVPQAPSRKVFGPCQFVGDYSGGDPPVPIPNTAVKPSSGDGTAGATRWESSSLPANFFLGPAHSRWAFLCARLPVPQRRRRQVKPARNRVRPGRFASKYWSLPCGANTARCGFLPAPRGAETVHGTRLLENAGPLPGRAGPRPPDEAHRRASSRRRTPGTPSTPAGAQRRAGHAGMVKVTRKRRSEDGEPHGYFHFLEPPPRPHRR